MGKAISADVSRTSSEIFWHLLQCWSHVFLSAMPFKFIIPLQVPFRLGFQTRLGKGGRMWPERPFELHCLSACARKQSFPWQFSQAAQSGATPSLQMQKLSAGLQQCCPSCPSWFHVMASTPSSQVGISSNKPYAGVLLLRDCPARSLEF